MSSSPHLSQFRLLAQYNSWSNDRLYTLSASLSEAERQRDFGAFFGSIHGTLSHLLLADRIWLGRFATGTPHTFQALQTVKLVFECESLSQILYPDFAELHQERLETDRAIEQWIQELEPDQLSAHLRYQNFARTIEREHSLWFGLTHFFNHQTHHRSQATTILHQLGQDYGVTDFLAIYDFAKEQI
jgi:uncharacterized damage-inducible protein DinB